MSGYPSLLTDSMARAARTLDGPIDVDELLHLICLAAVDTVDGADFAGITLADRRGTMETRAATHPVVREVDELQYELAQGPCIDAVRSGWPARSDDFAD